MLLVEPEGPRPLVERLQGFGFVVLLLGPLPDRLLYLHTRPGPPGQPPSYGCSLPRHARATLCGDMGAESACHAWQNGRRCTGKQSHASTDVAWAPIAALRSWRGIPAIHHRILNNNNHGIQLTQRSKRGFRQVRKTGYISTNPHFDESIRDRSPAQFSHGGKGAIGPRRAIRQRSMRCGALRRWHRSARWQMETMRRPVSAGLHDCRQRVAKYNSWSAYTSVLREDHFVAPEGDLKVLKCVANDESVPRLDRSRAHLTRGYVRYALGS